MTAVSAETLVRRFGAVAALDGLSFTVEERSLYGIIGPDGAGKTTFMRMAACLDMPDEGRLTIRGYDTRREAGRIRRIIGYMPQRFSLYGDLTVMENLRFFTDLFGVTGTERARILDRLLSFSRLGPFTAWRAENLSGGMKQKLALSCTLTHSPAVLFLDEPTTGVDPVSRREFWDLLADMRAEGTTIVVSTPYMDEAARCDRVGLIMNGRLVAEGTPGELPGMFRHAVLEVRGPKLVQRSRTLAFPESVLAVQIFGDRLHCTVDDPDRAAAELIAFLEKQGIEPVTVIPVKPSIEDVFMERMTDAR